MAIRKSIVGFEVLTALNTMMVVFWVVAQCTLVKFTNLHGFVTQNIAIFR
jgi:hypothetical protein